MGHTPELCATDHKTLLCYTLAVDRRLNEKQSTAVDAPTSNNIRT